MSWKVAFSGSRHGMTEKQQAHFVDFACNTTMVEFHHGGCMGADGRAEGILAELGAGGVWHVHPATLNPKWDAEWRMEYDVEWIKQFGIIMHEAKHPLERNKDIVRGADVLVAYPASDSKGTRHAIKMAERFNVPTIVVEA